MGKIIGIIIFLWLLLVRATPLLAQTPTQQFYKARVTKILSQGVDSSYGVNSPYQKVIVKMIAGDLKNQETTINYGVGYNLDPSQLVKVGDTVVVVKTHTENEDTYQISDIYRLDKVIPIIIFFFLAILLLSGWKGAGSILGMIISLGVIVGYVVPQILKGQDPLSVSIFGCLMIMVTTIYLAHGFSRKTTIALIATFLTLVGTGLLSLLFVKMAYLSGLGNEDAYSLKFGPTAMINFKGLLLGGILIGTLGVLDDVTTGLAASIFELAKANPAYKFKQLFRSGLIIGREHIASLVNTLVLAYAGASLPIFITFILNPNQYPVTFMLNDEVIMDEVVRTLGGSIGLVAAVPLTTFLAAYSVTKLWPSRK